MSPFETAIPILIEALLSFLTSKSIFSAGRELRGHRSQPRCPGHLHLWWQDDSAGAWTARGVKGFVVIPLARSTMEARTGPHLRQVSKGLFSA